MRVTIVMIGWPNNSRPPATRVRSAMVSLVRTAMCLAQPGVLTNRRDPRPADAAQRGRLRVVT